MLDGIYINLTASDFAERDGATAVTAQRGRDLKECTHGVIRRRHACRHVVWTVEGHKTLAQECCFRNGDALSISSRTVASGRGEDILVRALDDAPRDHF